MSRLLALLLVSVAAVLPGCGDDDGSPRSGAGPTSSSAPSLPSSPPKPTVTVPDGAPPTTLKTRDITVGTGAAAKAGDNLEMHYVGVSWSTKKEFDSSYGERPLPFQLGAGRLIPGWEQGVVGMRVGGRRELIIPPDLAYGPEGRPPLIGPNETLVFVVDLVAIQA